jgi:hypothetical protein
MPDLVTVEHDGFTVTSNTRSADEMTAGLTSGDEAQAVADADKADEQAARRGDATPDPSEAGRTLNKAKRDKIQERIDKSVAAQRNAERERDTERQARTAAERRAADLESRLTQPSAAPTQVVQQIENATSQAQSDAVEALPSLDQYDTIEAWQADVAAMIRKQTLEDFRAEQRAEKAHQVESQRMSAVQARIADFKSQHDDYESLVQSVQVPNDAPSHNALFAHLQFSEMGPQLAYYLAQHEDELQRIYSLPPGFAVAALGKLEGKLESQSVTKSKPAPSTAQAPTLVVSNAKPPIKPLGSSPVVADDAPDDMPFGAEYVRQMNARDRQARRSR